MKTVVTTRPAALVLASALAIVACKGKAHEAHEEAPTADPSGHGASNSLGRSAATVAVRLAPIVRGPIDRPIRAGGLVRAETELELGFEAPGKVSAVLVDEGAIVERGQVLARLDDTLVAAARSQAAETAAKAERDLARARRLEESGALPEVTRLDAQTGAGVARASLSAAWRAEAQSVLIAPARGRIDRRAVEVGQVVGAGQPILRLSTAARGAPLVVRVDLADRDVLGLALGGAATVALDARPGDRLAGTIRKIAPAATSGSGTFAVEIQAPALAVRTPSGLSAKVEIARVERPGSDVPAAAIVEGDGARAAVYRIEGGVARRLPVTVAFLHEDRAALLEPLAGIDAVVVAGAPQLVDGAAVRVIDDREASR
jgi:multidrug efflux system membrane fusion protein